MEQQEQEQTTVEEATTRVWTLARLEDVALRKGIIVGLVACVVALIGTVLGAVNFVSPTHYPVWALALWLIVDILLVTLTCLFGVLYVLIAWDTESAGDVVSLFGSIIFFIMAGILLTSKHFALVSVACLFLLLTGVIVNALIIVNRKK